MRPITASLVSLALSLGVATPAFAKCGDAPGDAAAVAAARAQVATDCDCAGAASHGDHVRCAAAVATIRAGNGKLHHQCESAVRKCAARSTCGKPGAVTCCRTKAGGVAKCTVKRRATSCTAPSGGQACVGTATSCCDACGATGCAGTTTTTTTSTTTTSVPTACGDTFPSCNGDCGPGAQCWPEEFPGVGCRCLPAGTTPCTGSSYPTCGGTCASGQRCQATSISNGGFTQNLCACVADESVCVPGAPTSSCPGACPVSHTCGIDVSFPSECFCQAAVPCNDGSGFPTCSGTCAAGSTCAPFRLGAFFSGCVCVPENTPCDASCGGGVCPAGTACTFKLAGGASTCSCDPLP